MSDIKLPQLLSAEEMRALRKARPVSQISNEALEKMPKETLLFDGTLDADELKEILPKVSPRPWTAILGRVVPSRIDLLDANGNLVMHMHPVVPSNEVTPNWRNDAPLVVHLLNSLENSEIK